MLFSNPNLEVGTNELRIGNKKVEQIGTNCKERYFKFVGHVLDDRLNWEGHIEHITKLVRYSNRSCGAGVRGCSC